MSNRSSQRKPSPCGKCGFELYNPVSVLNVSNVGMYNDARHPGRLIVTLRRHCEHFDQLRPNTMGMFMYDVQKCAGILRRIEGVERVNIAILGNKVPHVHAHIIPRYATEPNLGRSPWEDAAPLTELSEERTDAMVALLKSMFWADITTAHTTTS